MRRAVLTALLVTAPCALADWPDLSKPPLAVGGGQQDAALIVGAESYVALPPVPGAARNATDWYLYLANGLGIPPANLTLLRNNEATVEKLKKYAAQSASQVKAGGTLWFVFIGHGAPAKDGKDGVLVGFDAQQDADSLYARSLAQGELQALFAKGAQARTVMVLDACFSGRAAGGAPLVPGLQPVIALMAKPQAAKGAPQLVLSAGQNDQFAGPLLGVARPAFSYLVLGALRGWGDQNGDGAVDAREAVDYAGVALKATIKDRSQDPQLNGPVLPLARSGREPAPNLAALVVEKAAVGGPAPGVAPVAVAQPVAAPAAAAVGPAGARPAFVAPAGGPSMASYLTRESQTLTVAVPEFAFRGPPQPDLRWLAGSMADGVLAQLQRARMVKIVEPEQLDAAAKQLRLNPSAPLDATSTVRLGRAVGARLFVKGTVTSLGDQVQVEAYLLSVDTNERVGEAISVTGEPTRLGALRSEVGAAVAKALSLDPGGGDPTGLAAAVLDPRASADLERLRKLARTLPLLGLSPSASREAARWQNALMTVASLQQVYPNLAPAAVLGAQFSLQEGKDELERAQAQADLARQLSPGSVEAVLVSANAAHLRGDFNAAWAFAVDATTRFSDDARGWYLVARLQMVNRAYADAAVSLLGALERNPRVPEAETTLATLLADGSVISALGGNRRAQAAAATFRGLFRNDLQGAAAAAKETMSSSPALHVGYFVAGQNEKRAGNLAVAEHLLLIALSLRPDVAEVHKQLAELYLDTHRCADALLHSAWFSTEAVVIRINEGNTLLDRVRDCR